MAQARSAGIGKTDLEVTIGPRQMNTKRTPRKRSKIDKELAALRRMPDSKIDTSDIPGADAEFWTNAKRPAQTFDPD